MSHVIDPKTGQPVSEGPPRHGLTVGHLRRRARATKPRKPARRVFRKVGRNEPCPCASGKKFKHCHRAALERERQYA